MGTTLSTLKPPEGARQKRKRLGRGTGSGLGKTAGKGHKGQLARTGHGAARRGFEGGQMPMQRRLPKRGFKNPFRTVYAPVNIVDLAKGFEAGQQVDLDSMLQKGLVPRSTTRVKVLGSGEINISLKIQAQAFSRSAMEKIEKAGGTVEIVPPKRRARKCDEAEEVEHAG